MKWRRSFASCATISQWRAAETFTLDACRHGGMTELEEAELTDGQGRALSGHRTQRAYEGYAKRTFERALPATGSDTPTPSRTFRVHPFRMRYGLAFRMSPGPMTRPLLRSL